MVAVPFSIFVFNGLSRKAEPGMLHTVVCVSCRPWPHTVSGSALTELALNYTPAMTTDSENDTYIKTTTHNFVSRQATIESPERVELKGKSILSPFVTLRGDLAIIRLGRYCFISSGSTLSPAALDSERFVPMILRGHVVVGTNCQISASAIGTNVFVGDNVTIGERVIIKDVCYIESNSKIGDDTIIPPFSRVRGSKVVEELPASASMELQELAQQRYQEFVANNPRISSD